LSFFIVFYYNTRDDIGKTSREGHIMSKLSVKGFAITAGLLWAASILLVGGLNRFCPGGYGFAFLNVLDSIYPGFHAATGFKSVIIGSIYGFFDGAIGCAIFAWVYNKVTGAK
jgi:hypothetical protein